MTTTTEEAERLALSLEIADQPATAETIRSLAAERDALRANLDAIVIPTTYYMDPPDGGDVSIAEQVSRMYRHVCDLQAENARLRKALEFYGDVSKYPSPLTGGMGALWSDCGQIARAALEGKAMTKINQGGVECKLTKKAGRDTTITINLSSVGRHAIGPWKIEIVDGALSYLVTVVLEGKKDE
jgi:hypothetical protein